VVYRGLRAHQHSPGTRMSICSQQDRNRSALKWNSEPVAADPGRWHEFPSVQSMGSLGRHQCLQDKKDVAAGMNGLIRECMHFIADWSLACLPVQCERAKSRTATTSSTLKPRGVEGQNLARHCCCFSIIKVCNNKVRHNSCQCWDLLLQSLLYQHPKFVTPTCTTNVI
jgi:hypothetical protein